jgi:hypothetical protein
MRNHYRRITKREWYDLGGFANSKLFRKANARGVWSYYQIAD